jgi:hypothetical protein
MGWDLYEVGELSARIVVLSIEYLAMPRISWMEFIPPKGEEVRTLCTPVGLWCYAHSTL